MLLINLDEPFRHAKPILPCIFIRHYIYHLWRVWFFLHLMFIAPLSHIQVGQRHRQAPTVTSLVLIVYVFMAVLLLCWLGSPEMHTTFFLSPLTSCRSCAWKEHSVHSFSLDHDPSPALNQGLHLNGVLSSLAWSAFIPAVSYLPSFKRHPYTNMFSTHLLHIKYCWQKDLPSSGE